MGGAGHRACGFPDACGPWCYGRRAVRPQAGATVERSHRAPDRLGAPPLATPDLDVAADERRVAPPGGGDELGLGHAERLRQGRGPAGS